MDSGRQTLSDDDMALDLGGLFRALGRAMGWLLPLTLIVAFGVFFALQFVAPKYKGEARILIESTDINIPGGNRGVEGERALLDSEGVASQIQLLMATDLARKVARKMDLAAVPEFGARGGQSLVGKLLSVAGFDRGPAGDTAEERVLKHYFENLDVYRLDESRVIAVDYAAEDPLLAAEVANTIVDEFLALQSSAKRQSTEMTSAALEPQIVELRKDVQSARQAVADFRARADLLIGADNIPLNQQQLADTSSDYSAAQATKAEAQAKAELIRELLNSGGSLETASDVLNSQLIQRLRERQVEIQSNIAELSITLLPNHPQIKALQSQLNDYDRQIRSEARKILQGLENDARVANQQALALGRRLEDLKVAAAKSNADQARLSELEREADAKAAQLDQLLLSFQEADTRLRAQILPADARIVSRANVPVEPFSPKVVPSTIVAALMTFILGCAYVVMRELLSGRVLYSTGKPQGTMRPDTAEMPVPPAKDTSGSFTWGPSYQTGYQGYKFDNKIGDLNSPEEVEDTPNEIEEPEYEPEPIEEEVPAEPAPRRKTLRGKRGAAYDQDVSPDWLGTLRSGQDDVEETPVSPRPARRKAKPAAPDALAASDVAAEGRIVVLSVDEPDLSHQLAFDLARKAAGEGDTALFMEVFPEQEDTRAAEGFADIVAGKAPFAKVVYRDAGSKAHIIEAGRLAITDEMVRSDRFKLALDAIQSTYETVVVDLGAIDGTLASARMLSFADRVLIAASAPDHSHELESAANLLAHNTGASVEIVVAGDPGAGPQRNGDGHAA
ncbi:exopolysaccharide transport family protein [Labrenzia sp. PHM005]|uniref:exopolysaccharide transport family protein n=1 Tax=Labrenzia sp. PHM005 TaxID=2590016 RepID=UPI00113FD4E0|nr:exopolysaccharide transport family protein [Labrenzia sp. PHM005]QDG78157.1 succinoglycan transporter [Labrenzia sp. PHM005]